MNDWDDEPFDDGPPEWDDSLIAEDEARVAEAQYQLEETEQQLFQHAMLVTQPQPQSKTTQGTQPPSSQSQSQSSQPPPLSQPHHQSHCQVLAQPTAAAKRKLFDHNNTSIGSNVDGNDATKRAKLSSSSHSQPPCAIDLVDLREPLPVPRARQYIYHHPPLKGEYLTVTDANDGCYYLTREKEDESEELLPAWAAERRRSGGLLIDGNIRHLIAQIDEEDHQRALELSVTAIQAQQHNNTIASANNKSAAAPRRSRSNQLWVDKYAPRRFTELLSPDSVNRAVLSWVLEWDTCVFGDKRTNQTTQPVQLITTTKHRITAPKTLSLAEALASRPEQHVLLLSGPAGLGKTTMSHIIAAHAGYSVIELNASDDRTEDALMNKVRGGVEFKESAWSRGGLSHGKPHCLILDEIDGVADTGGEKNAITALCKLVLAEFKDKSGANADADADANDGRDSDEETETVGSNKEKVPAALRRRQRGGARKNSKLPPLRRPIICICNDPWIPALRPLRAIAAHYTLSNNNRDAMLSRMKHIARSEKMDVEDRALTLLIDRVAGDIRAAIHSMQFMHERHAGRLTVSSINGLNVGIKDMQGNRRDLLDRIFTNESTVKKRLSQKNAMINKHSTLASELGRADDGEKLVGILHANYLSLPSSDNRMLHIVNIAHAFSAIDGRGIYENVGDGDGDGSALWPYTALTIHNHVQQAPPRKIRVDVGSSVSFNIFQRSSANLAIMQTWLHDPLNTFTVCGVTPRRVCVEYLSHTLGIISPAVKPVSIATMSQAERGRVESLIDNMANMSLTYRPDTAPSAALMTLQPFVLQPQIDQLMRYEFTVNISSIAQTQNTTFQRSRFRQPLDSSKPLDQRYRPASLHIMDFDSVPHKLKALLAREVEIAHMRKNEKILIDDLTAKQNSGQLRASARNTAQDRLTLSGRTLETSPTKAAATDAAPARRRPTTFLSEHSAKLKARSRPKGSGDMEGGTKSTLTSGSFHFAFKEGFTQAVKRAIKHSYFL